MGKRVQQIAVTLSADASKVIYLIEERSRLKNDICQSFLKLREIDQNAAKEYRELVDNLDYWYRDK
jgi:hypothetical protein